LVVTTSFSILGGPGDDIICGGLSNDFIDGGPGKDQISGGYGEDVLLGGPENDRLSGDPGTDILIGGPGIDTGIDPDPETLRLSIENTR
jgi:Ca2+-binding RTX toxin-like protein